MASSQHHDILGPPLEDASEETFELFSQQIPSNDLGFVDSRQGTIQVEIAGHEYELRQSPALLKSNRKEGTTGAVLWKVTPLLAAWLASFPAMLADLNALHPNATVVELGCGLAGLIGLVLSRVVKCYVLTDQEYVMKYLKENISANSHANKPQLRATKKRSSPRVPDLTSSLKTMALDWETDRAENLLAVISSEDCIDLVILCDCVYNDFLVKPLIQMMIDICRLGLPKPKQTVVLIAQQLRSDSIFEFFLDSLMQEFHVWRMSDDKITPDLRSNTGYVVHLAMLKSAAKM
ncbi:hypothetical protein PV08_11773 [Exophiala spinifera]|uniref:Uncharacterized protein n=1 Tax=Exophiala spinifera TaxID=91928 RepID=A0A0D1ZAI5_9EURO|nr:uncharacterized protein PV08_11773 [Exophiala spinifera]KIW09997.1 hypothetical protein PV08_11773 [Exophiala spinifera]